VNLCVCPGDELPIVPDPIGAGELVHEGAW
jgi:hypothetical protein